MKSIVLAGLLSLAASFPQISRAAETTHATGVIAVSKYEPVPYDGSAEPKLVGIAVEETFSGDLQGKGTVRFLQALRSDGSASFCGLERFTGTVGGRQGSFVLQDTGSLKGDQVEGTWFIVPGSGTGQLADIQGTGGFKAKLGEHAAVTLDYSFEK